MTYKNYILFISLYLGLCGSIQAKPVPSNNYMTTDTTQTVTGSKTFTGPLTISGPTTFPNNVELTDSAQTVTGNRIFSGTVTFNGPTNFGSGSNLMTTNTNQNVSAFKLFGYQMFALLDGNGNQVGVFPALQNSGANLLIPNLQGRNDTIMTLGTIQTITGVKTLAPVAAPEAGPISGWTIYVDSADGSLKVMSSSGKVVPLAIP